MNTKLSNFRIKEDEKSKLAEMALLNNVSMSDLIRAMINNAYNSEQVQQYLIATLEEQKARDALEKAGLNPTSYNVHYGDKKMPDWKELPAHPSHKTNYQLDNNEKLPSVEEILASM